MNEPSTPVHIQPQLYQYFTYLLAAHTSFYLSDSTEEMERHSLQIILEVISAGYYRTREV